MDKNPNLQVKEYRDNSIDILKGFGIFCVIVGHCGAPYLLTSIIYMFHMPLFFFLSGMVHKDYNICFSDFIRKKANALLYPYFMMGGIITIYNCLLRIKQFSIDMLVKRLIALFYGNYIWENNYDYIGVLWFLICLFCVEVIFEIVRRSSKKNKSIVIIITAITFIGYLLAFFINYTRIFTKYGQGVRLPFCLDIALCTIIFYTFGYFSQIYFKNLKKIVYLLFMISGFLIGVLNQYLYSSRPDLLYLRFNNPMLFIISASLVSLGMYGLGSIFYHNKILIWLGKNSLVIMVTHMYLIVYINKILELLGGGKNWLITSILDLICSCVLVLLINRFFPFVVRNTIKRRRAYD